MEIQCQERIIQPQSFPSLILRSHPRVKLCCCFDRNSPPLTHSLLPSFLDALKVVLSHCQRGASFRRSGRQSGECSPKHPGSTNHRRITTTLRTPDDNCIYNYSHSYSRRNGDLCPIYLTSHRLAFAATMPPPQTSPAQAAHAVSYGQVIEYIQGMRSNGANGLWNRISGAFISS